MDIRPIDANALKTKAHITRTRALDNLTIENVNVSVDEIDNAPTLSLNTLRDAIYQDAVDHGLWEDADRWAKCWDYMGDDFARKELWNAAAQMVKSEANELVDVSVYDIYDKTDNRESYIEELADVVIMCFSTAGKLGIDIDAAIRRKMEINKKRPWKHEEE